ncbi:hypothetical protein D3C80_1842420 [compost metagenome]
MIQRLGSAEVQQRDADTRGKQHAGPSAIAEVGFVVLTAKLELAETGEGQNDHKYQVGADHQHVIPAKAACQPGLGDVEHFPGFLRYSDKQGSQHEDQQRRGDEHHAVDPDPLGGGLGKGGRTHCT